MSLGRQLAGVAVGVVLVAIISATIGLLNGHVPVLSLVGLYVLAVLPVALAFGAVAAIGVSVLSVFVFNFFFLPPVHTFDLAESSNWFALLVFVVTATAVSVLAARSRQREREAVMLAAVATTLLRHGGLEEKLEQIAAETAAAFGSERARVRFDTTISGSSETAEVLPLVADGHRVGALVLEGGRGSSRSARRRLLPALTSLLGLAVDRERLASEALRAEALRRSDATKTAILRAVSHDLRTPLMAILTSASSLARKDLTLDEDDREELLRTVVDEAGRLSGHVDNLLDLSRLQAGAAPPAPTVAAVDDLVIRAVADLGAAAERVEVTLPEDLPVVRVDAYQLERVVANLLENALKYSPPGERVRLTVQASETEVAIRVIDRGPGLEPDELERIFEPFQRGTSSSGTRGAGLGLAIARGFAEANGCRVRAESRHGQGATFVVTLPAVAVELPE